jgi:ABC-type proline/glycine betaine transport system permease subunit
VPLCLGLAGLIPFWVLAIGLGQTGLRPWESTALDFALVTYAAVIISFLGGIRWGLAVAHGEREDSAVHYIVSIVPSLAAWGLLILPEPQRLLCLGVLALLLGPIDQRLVASGFAPPWFGHLRLILSCGAGLALLYAAAVCHGR